MRFADATDVPELAERLFVREGARFDRLQAEVAELDGELAAWRRKSELSQRLGAIPGIGELGSMMLPLKTPDPRAFKSGRNFAAWIGLTARDHSTAGKLRLGVITKAGDERLRAVLVNGALDLAGVAAEAVRRGYTSLVDLEHGWQSCTAAGEARGLERLRVLDAQIRARTAQLSKLPADGADEARSAQEAPDGPF